MAATHIPVDAAYLQHIIQILKIKASLLLGSPFLLPWGKDSVELGEVRKNWMTISGSIKVQGKEHYQTSDFMLRLFDAGIYELWHDPGKVFDQLQAQLLKLRTILLHSGD